MHLSISLVIGENLKKKYFFLNYKQLNNKIIFSKNAVFGSMENSFLIRYDLTASSGFLIKIMLGKL